MKWKYLFNILQKKNIYTALAGRAESTLDLISDMQSILWCLVFQLKCPQEEEKFKCNLYSVIGNVHNCLRICL